MNHKHSRFIIALTILSLFAGNACAVSFNGTVAPISTHEIYAPIGGTVDQVKVSVGQKVNVGDVLATLSTTKVYAPEAGVITGIFGEPGDSAENIGERYGAVMYIEGETVYTIAASTDNAYNTTANKFVHVGEEVYLSCYSDGTHVGTGVITSIEGTDYNVNVLSGEFLVGETISIYRGDSAVSADRIGRGTLSRKSPTAVSGSGSIVSIAVNNGDSVEKGDLLFETLEGNFDGLYMSGSEIIAEESGVIAQINMQQGDKLEKNSVAAVLYPEGQMRVEAAVSEYNLGELAAGDSVNVELIWNQDAEVSYPGSISMISAIANESTQEGGEDQDITYNVYIDFTPDENTRYGMSAVITTAEEGEAENALN